MVPENRWTSGRTDRSTDGLTDTKLENIML